MSAPRVARRPGPLTHCPYCSILRERAAAVSCGSFIKFQRHTLTLHILSTLTLKVDKERKNMLLFPPLLENSPLFPKHSRLYNVKKKTTHNMRYLRFTLFRRYLRKWKLKKLNLYFDTKTHKYLAKTVWFPCQISKTLPALNITQVIIKMAAALFQNHAEFCALLCVCWLKQGADWQPLLRNTFHHPLRSKKMWKSGWFWEPQWKWNRHVRST